MNWIEKVIESLKKAKFLFQSKYAEGYDELWERDALLLRKTIVSHAPVIDAEALAEIMEQQLSVWRLGSIIRDPIPEKEKRESILAQLITSSIDLDITWSEGLAEWGNFQLEVQPYGDEYYWFIELSECGTEYSGYKKSQEDCQQACEQALRSIVSGIKQ